MPDDPSQRAIPVQTAKPKTPLTAYVVLAKDADKDWWLPAAKIGARSGEDAIRRHIEDVKAAGGVFVAVPARSWQPVKVATKVETSVVIEDA